MLQCVVERNPEQSVDLGGEPDTILVYGWIQPAQIESLFRSRGLRVHIRGPYLFHRETFSHATETEYRHRGLIGGVRQFAQLKLRIEPNAAGKGNVFSSEIHRAPPWDEFIQGVEDGVKSVLANGLASGLPLIDTRIALCGGAFHETDSSADAFSRAASLALNRLDRSAVRQTVETVMRLDVMEGDGVVADVADVVSPAPTRLLCPER
jgi:elongation factor G